MGSIVVGIDGSEVSRRALDEALRLAEDRSLDLIVVHVVHTIAVAMYPSFDYTDLNETLARDGARLVADEIDCLRNRTDHDIDLAIKFRVAHGHPGTEMVRIATDVDGTPAEMVVLGSRGRGPLKSLLLGSVTTFVLHHLCCPVLVIPDSGRGPASS